VVRLGFQKFICVIAGVGGFVGVGVGGLDWSRPYRLKPFLRNLRPKMLMFYAGDGLDQGKKVL
jgi:hypothetical protein